MLLVSNNSLHSNLPNAKQGKDSPCPKYRKDIGIIKTVELGPYDATLVLGALIPRLFCSLWDTCVCPDEEKLKRLHQKREQIHSFAPSFDVTWRATWLCLQSVLPSVRATRHCWMHMQQRGAVLHEGTVPCSMEQSCNVWTDL